MRPNRCAGCVDQDRRRRGETFAALEDTTDLSQRPVLVVRPEIQPPKETAMPAESRPVNAPATAAPVD